MQVFQLATDWIIAVDAGDEVRALPDGDTVLVTPFNPLVIGISRLYESPPTLSGPAFSDSRLWINYVSDCTMRSRGRCTRKTIGSSFQRSAIDIRNSRPVDFYGQPATSAFAVLVPFFPLAEAAL